MIFQKDVNNIKGLCVIEPQISMDSIGLSMEIYNKKEFFENGLDMTFVQDNQVKSNYGVLRGLHVNQKHPQGKLIRVISGKIFDVVVDLRLESNSFSQWFGIELSSQNKKQLYIPEGFAHGYLVLQQDTEVAFKVTTHYIPGDELGIAWNSKKIGILWPSIRGEYLISDADRNNAELNL